MEALGAAEEAEHMAAVEAAAVEAVTGRRRPSGRRR